MNFLKAVKIADANGHLIGKSMNGCFVDEIIIMPTSDEEQGRFQTRYIRCLNPQEAITPFITSDVEVYALFDKRRIRTEGVFLAKALGDLPEELGASFDVE